VVEAGPTLSSRTRTIGLCVASISKIRR